MRTWSGNTDCTPNPVSGHRLCIRCGPTPNGMVVGRQFVALSERDRLNHYQRLSGYAADVRHQTAKHGRVGDVHDGGAGEREIDRLRWQRERSAVRVEELYGGRYSLTSERQHVLRDVDADQAGWRIRASGQVRQVAAWAAADLENGPALDVERIKKRVQHEAALVGVEWAIVAGQGVHSRALCYLVGDMAPVTPSVVGGHSARGAPFKAASLARS